MLTKARTFNTYKKNNEDLLARHDRLHSRKIIEHYAETCDLPILASPFLIEKRKNLLRNGLTPEEARLGGYMIKHSLPFIHMAPLKIDGQIYFSPFLLPEQKIELRIIDCDWINSDQILESAKWISKLLKENIIVYFVSRDLICSLPKLAEKLKLVINRQP